MISEGSSDTEYWLLESLTFQVGLLFWKFMLLYYFCGSLVFCLVVSEVGGGVLHQLHLRLIEMLPNSHL